MSGNLWGLVAHIILRTKYFSKIIPLVYFYFFSSYYCPMARNGTSRKMRIGRVRESVSDSGQCCLSGPVGSALRTLLLNFIKITIEQWARQNHHVGLPASSHGDRRLLLRIRRQDINSHYVTALLLPKVEAAFCYSYLSKFHIGRGLYVIYIT